MREWKEKKRLTISQRFSYEEIANKCEYDEDDAIQ